MTTRRKNLTQIRKEYQKHLDAEFVRKYPEGRIGTSKWGNKTFIHVDFVRRAGYSYGNGLCIGFHNGGEDIQVKWYRTLPVVKVRYFESIDKAFNYIRKQGASELVMYIFSKYYKLPAGPELLETIAQDDMVKDIIKENNIRRRLHNNLVLSV